MFEQPVGTERRIYASNIKESTPAKEMREKTEVEQLVGTNSKTYVSYISTQQKYDFANKNGSYGKSDSYRAIDIPLTIRRISKRNGKKLISSKTYKPYENK